MIVEADRLAFALAVLFAMIGVVAAALWRLIERDTRAYDEKFVWFRRVRDDSESD